ncbi:MAG: ABC transporter permease [Desulfobacterales bacterium]|nr:ABC transporter permease [Desulfobacterales bacterium]
MENAKLKLSISENSLETTFFFKGNLDAEGVAKVWVKAKALILKTSYENVIFDLSQVLIIDFAGAALLLHLETLILKQITKESSVKFVNVNLKHEQTLQLCRKNFITSEKIIVHKKQDDFITATGKNTFSFLDELSATISFTGEITIAVFKTIFKPKTLRWKEFFLIFEKTGVDALFIVALISFIVGLVMAFQAAMPMRMFGAEIYVANLIGLSVTRELGPLMTAIVLAGRSSSAFAAEIGTMKINEEVDALLTMGIDPVYFLALPRILAAAIVTPLLVLFADLVGIIGGAIVLVSLGHPISAYYAQVINQVSCMDLTGGLIKAFVFGILIASTGCFKGLRTQTGPSGVGMATTQAVVNSIIIIALADAVFSIIFYIFNI